MPLENLERKLAVFQQQFLQALALNPKVLRDKNRIIAQLKYSLQLETTPDRLHQHFQGEKSKYSEDPDFCAAFIDCTTEVMALRDQYNGQGDVSGFRALSDLVEYVASDLKGFSLLTCFQDKLADIQKTRETVNRNIETVYSHNVQRRELLDVCPGLIDRTKLDGERLIAALEAYEAEFPLPQRQALPKALHYTGTRCSMPSPHSVRELKTCLELDEYALRFFMESEFVISYYRGWDAAHPAEKQACPPVVLERAMQARTLYEVFSGMYGQYRPDNFLQPSQIRVDHAIERLSGKNFLDYGGISEEDRYVKQLNDLFLKIEDLHSRHMHGVRLGGRDYSRTAEATLHEIEKLTGLSADGDLRSVRESQDRIGVKTYMQAAVGVAKATHDDITQAQEGVRVFGASQEARYNATYKHSKQVTEKAVAVVCVADKAVHHDRMTHSVVHSYTSVTFVTLLNVLLDQYTHYAVKRENSDPANFGKALELEHDVLKTMFTLMTKALDVYPDVDICQRLSPDKKELLRHLVNRTGIEPPLVDADVTLEQFLGAFEFYQEKEQRALKQETAARQHAAEKAHVAYSEMLNIVEAEEKAALEQAEAAKRAFDNHKRRVLDRTKKEKPKQQTQDPASAQPVEVVQPTYDVSDDRLHTSLARYKGNESAVLEAFYYKAVSILNSKEEGSIDRARNHYGQLAAYGKQHGLVTVEAQGILGLSSCDHLEALPLIKNAMTQPAIRKGVILTLSRALDLANTALATLEDHVLHALQSDGEVHDPKMTESLDAAQMQATHIAKTMDHIETMASAKKEAALVLRSQAMRRMGDAWFNNEKAKRGDVSQKAQEFRMLTEAEGEISTCAKTEWQPRIECQCTLRLALPEGMRSRDHLALPGRYRHMTQIAVQDIPATGEEPPARMLMLEEGAAASSHQTEQSSWVMRTGAKPPTQKGATHSLAEPALLLQERFRQSNFVKMSDVAEEPTSRRRAVSCERF